MQQLMSHEYAKVIVHRRLLILLASLVNFSVRMRHLDENFIITESFGNMNGGC